MPNRIIKESIRTSKTVNAMTDFQFRVWVYLITYVDDYGRGSADPELIKGFVFPRRKRLSESDIEKALAELAGMGCISLYKVDGESYFCFPNWGSHQRIQTKKSKFPAPSETQTVEEKGDHGESPWATVDHREPPPESESKSESNTPHTPQGADDGFDTFWAAYPKKVGKGEARKAWGKIKPKDDLRRAIVEAVEKQKLSDQWQRENGRFVPNPATWLNQQRWEDELDCEPEPDPFPCDGGEMLPDTQRVHLPEDATLDDILALIP